MSKLKVAIKKHTFVHYLVTGVYYLISGAVGSVIWLLIGFAGAYIFQTKISPYDKIIGLPLVLVGFGMAVNNIFSTSIRVLSPRFNKSVCFFCNKD